MSKDWWVGWAIGAAVGAASGAAAVKWAQDRTGTFGKTTPTAASVTQAPPTLMVKPGAPVMTMKGLGGWMPGGPGYQGMRGVLQIQDPNTGVWKTIPAQKGMPTQIRHYECE